MNNVQRVSLSFQRKNKKKKLTNEVFLLWLTCNELNDNLVTSPVSCFEKKTRASHDTVHAKQLLPGFKKIARLPS